MFVSFHIFRFSFFFHFSFCAHSCKNFMIPFFPFCLFHSRVQLISLTLSHCENISHFLQSREFLFVVSPLFTLLLMLYPIGVNLWCPAKSKKWFVLFRFVHFAVGMFCFVCLFVFLLFANKSHSFSWTWHLELFLFHHIYSFYWEMVITCCVSSFVLFLFYLTGKKTSNKTTA